MNKLVFRAVFVALSMCFAFSSCKSSSESVSGKKVAYQVANRYFVNNSVTGAVPAKIATQQDFDKYFGAAAVMGKNGTPTQIDFSRQFVVAISQPVTNVDTEIRTTSIRKEEGTLKVYYRLVEGETRSYSIRPLQLLIVDKKYDGNVQLVKE